MRWQCFVILLIFLSISYGYISVGGKKGQRYLRSVKRDGIRDTRKPSSPEKPTSSVPSEAISPRVRNDINVPVRRQIAWAKAAKKLMTAAKVIGPKVSRKYKKGTNEQPIIDEDLSNVDFSTMKPPAVFVDGYNVIGYMRTVEGTQMNLEEARDCLISDLAILHGATGWHIEVVFDAYQVKGTQNTEEVSGILVTFPASSETADNYIERRFEELRKEGFTNMVVATNDRMLQNVAGSSGLGYLSASMLLKEMRAAYRGWDEYERKLEEEAEKHAPRLGDMISSDMLTFIKEEMKRTNG